MRNKHKRTLTNRHFYYCLKFNVLPAVFVIMTVHFVVVQMTALNKEKEAGENRLKLCFRFLGK